MKIYFIPVAIFVCELSDFSFLASFVCFVSRLKKSQNYEKDRRLNFRFSRSPGILEPEFDGINSVSRSN